MLYGSLKKVIEWANDPSHPNKEIIRIEYLGTAGQHEENDIWGFWWYTPEQLVEDIGNVCERCGKTAERMGPSLYINGIRVCEKCYCHYIIKWQIASRKPLKAEKAFLEIMEDAENAECWRGLEERQEETDLEHAFQMQKEAYVRSLFYIWLYDENTDHPLPEHKPIQKQIELNQYPREIIEPKTDTYMINEKPKLKWDTFTPTCEGCKDIERCNKAKINKRCLLYYPKKAVKQELKPRATFRCDSCFSTNSELLKAGEWVFDPKTHLSTRDVTLRCKDCNNEFESMEGQWG